MAYTHTQYSLQIGDALTLSTLADIGDAHIFAVKTRIRSAAVAITTDTTVAVTVVGIDRRITSGSDTGRVQEATITVPVGSQGEVYKNEGLDITVEAGQQIVIDTDGGCTAGAGSVVLLCEPIWETGANETNTTVVTV